MSLQMINPGIDVPNDFNVIIEIPAHSAPIKYEIDKATGALFVDRFMATAMRYPCDYGYIPQTLSEDGDPLDVLVLSPLSLNAGCVLRCRPLGLLKMTDESGIDYKILAVPIEKLTPFYNTIQDLCDVPIMLIKQINHFFTHYKDLEEGKWVVVNDWQDKAFAKTEIIQAIQRHNASCVQEE